MGAKTGKTQYKAVEFLGTGEYLSKYSLVKIVRTTLLEDAFLFRDRIHADNYLRQFHGAFDPMKLIDVDVTITVAG